MPAKPSLRLGFDHGDDQKIDLEALDGRVGLVPAWPRRRLMVQGIDQTFGDAVNWRVREYASEAQFASALADSTNSQRLMEIKFSVSARKRIDPSDCWRILKWP